MTLLLCGMPFSGKTTYGTCVADKLQIPLFDTDRLLEELFYIQTGMRHSCRKIYALYGAEYFRGLEAQTVDMLKEKLIHYNQSIIALGGGMLSQMGCATQLQRIGKLIYLQTPLNTLIERMLKQSTLPSYLDHKDPIASFKMLADRRLSLYDLHSHITLNTGQLSEQLIVSKLCQIAIENGSYGE
jgi:shikimate kinase